MHIHMCLLLPAVQDKPDSDTLAEFIQHPRRPYAAAGNDRPQAHGGMHRISLCPQAGGQAAGECAMSTPAQKFAIKKEGTAIEPGQTGPSSTDTSPASSAMQAQSAVKSGHTLTGK